MITIILNDHEERMRSTRDYSKTLVFGSLFTDLSVWSRYENPVSNGISNACFHPLKITDVDKDKYIKKLYIEN